jgi:carbonic anhydrase
MALSREPRDGRDALDLLDAGNRRFATLASTGTGDAQEAARGAFAVVLGCAESRLPIELVFGRSFADLFVVRQAGNTAGEEAIGSIEYAVRHVPTIRAIAVVGHSGCGTVAAAVDAFLRPPHALDLAASSTLRAIVDRIHVCVRQASTALHLEHGSRVVDEPGYRRALADVTAFLNAAYSAFCVRAALPADAASRVGVGFCVYDAATGRISSGVPTAATFAAPPDGPARFRTLARTIAATPRTRGLLQAGGGDSAKARPA